jgi:hypothetical protein
MSTTPTPTHKANGILRHHFWGHYVADIVLRFDDPASIPTALEALAVSPDASYRGATGGQYKTEWKQSERDPRAILITASGETLEEIQTKLVAWGADKKKMNSMTTNINHGEQFSIEF